MHGDESSHQRWILLYVGYGRSISSGYIVNNIRLKRVHRGGCIVAMSPETVGDKELE